jgi:anti-sigma B factor antagonist
MGFQVEVRELDRIIVVDVVGRLTLSDSRTQLRDLVHIFTGRGRKKFLINLAGLDFVDSDGLGELTRCYSIVRQAGGEMKLVHVREIVQALLEMTRLINLFEIYSEEHVALQAFREKLSHSWSSAPKPALMARLKPCPFTRVAQPNPTPLPQQSNPRPLWE